MSRLIGRNYRLVIKRGADELVYGPPMQVRFSVDNRYGAEGSLAEITLYGASQDTRRAIYNQFDGIVLSAGYGEGIGIVFAGDIINTEIGREGVDKYIKFFCRTAGKQQAQSVISKAWGAGTPQIDIIRDVAESMLLPVEFIGDFSDLPRAIKGRMMCSSSIVCLNELAEIHDFVWSMSENRLIIIRKGADGTLATRNTEPHLISAATGMVGSPQILIQQIEVTKKLDPTIIPGDRVDVQSETRNFAFSQVYTAEMMVVDPTGGSGIYSVLNVTHKGDFYGDTWDTTVTGIRE
jgi:hypothetical protein